MDARIKVLLMFAGTSTDKSQFRLEARAIRESIRNVGDRACLELAAGYAQDPFELRQQLLLLANEPTIVHLVGDGLNPADGESERRSMGTALLRGAFIIFSQIVRLVVLSGSDTLRTAEELSTDINFVIGMDGSITDHAAATFAASFYGGLASGLSIAEAFEAGMTNFRLEAQDGDGSPRLLIQQGADPTAHLTLTDSALHNPFSVIVPYDSVRADLSAADRVSDASTAPDYTERTRTAVFISYSHKDRKWLERLQIHLRPLERDHALEVWDDTKIRPGTNWRNEIRDAISNARVAILLITADFLASDYISKNELPPLLEAAEKDGALILPIIVSPCRFEKVEKLARFQAVNDPNRPLTDLKGANRERVFIKVADEVEAALRS